MRLPALALALLCLLWAAAFCAQPLGAATSGTLTTQQTGEWLAGRLIGTQVKTRDGEVIGSVDDIVVDANGSVLAIIIGIGGVPGFPARDIAVPFQAVTIGPVVDNQRVVSLDSSRAALEAAPDYRATDPGWTDRLRQRTSEWTEQAVDLGKRVLAWAAAFIRDKTDGETKRP